MQKQHANCATVLRASADDPSTNAMGRVRTVTEHLSIQAQAHWVLIHATNRDRANSGVTNAMVQHPWMAYCLRHDNM